MSRRLILPGIALLASILSCSDSGSISRTPPFLAASADKIDFGERKIGSEEERTIYLINKGQVPLQLELPEGDSNSGVFAVLLDAYTVAVEQNTVARIKFLPADPIEYSTHFVLPNNSSNQPILSIAVTGKGVLPDPCEGVDCSTAPTPSCVNESTSRHYEPLGTCVDSRCEHTYQDDVCDRGCDVATGTCRRDPCEGMACNTPPSPCYLAQGTCTEGACQYQPNNAGLCSDSNPCTANDHCEEGNCVGDPIVCASSPAPVCVDANHRQVWNAQGVCSSGTGACEYQSQQQFCEFGCSPEGCGGDPCSGITCDQPPSPQCFTSTGVCVNGVCEYGLVPGACDDGSACTANDTCSNGSCRGSPITCNSPPPPDCAAADTRRVYDSVGTCSNGECQYAATTIGCSDSNACTSNDYCSAGACHSGAALNCDDGNPCTSDTCDQVAGCRHAATSGGACTSASGECPVGTCWSGTCRPVPNVTCVTTYQADLCNEAEIAGVCSASGECVVDEVPPEFICPGCPGICLQCFFIQLCIPL